MSDGQGTQDQDAMDELFGVGESRDDILRAVGHGSAQGQNEYNLALLEGRELFPNDGIAQHRFAQRAMNRVTPKTGNEPG